MSPGNHERRPAGNRSGVERGGLADLSSEYATNVLPAELDGADWWWLDCAWRALLWSAEVGDVFDAYSLTELGMPDPDHPCRLGGLFSAARNAGLITRVGYAPSRRLSRRGSVVALWRGTAKARLA